jgi:CNT family concentrative nucleoside transporter
MTGLNLISLLGLVVLAAIAWAAGGFRRPFPARTVFGAGAVMLVVGAGVFWLPPARAGLLLVNDLILSVLSAGQAGARFLFGPLALNPGETGPGGEASIGFVLAAQVLPAVIFFASLMGVLYHLRVMEPVVRTFARLFHQTMRLSGAEALSGAANIFVGVETAMTVRPYLERMTRSELLTLLSCGMATVASTTLAIYVSFLKGSFPLIAGHLVSASVVAIPAAVVASKLLLPEDGTPETLGAVPPLDRGERHANAFAALAAGAWDGLRLAAGIATLLIAVLGVVALVDLALGKAPGDLSLARLLGWVFAPLAWLLGLDAKDVLPAATLLGQRAILTEVVAYGGLAKLAAEGSITPRTVLVMSYALCGFAHVASVGIFVGGTAALCPSRRDDLAGLGPKALIAATLATLMTGALAGVFYHGQTGLIAP